MYDDFGFFQTTNLVFVRLACVLGALRLFHSASMIVGRARSGALTSPSPEVLSLPARDSLEVTRRPGILALRICRGWLIRLVLRHNRPKPPTYGHQEHVSCSKNTLRPLKQKKHIYRFCFSEPTHIFTTMFNRANSAILFCKICLANLFRQI